MEREMDLRGKEAVSLSSLVKKEYQIPDSYYFGEVKRGLRNSDGTGVLIGVTKVGSVQGYLIEDGRRIPVPGKLYYRGIDLNEIVEAHRKSGTFGYEEVAYLLLMGHLPTKSELSYFNDIMCRARKLPEGFTEGMIMRHPSRDIMNDLARSVLLLYSYDENPDDISAENLLTQSIKLIGSFPAIVANAYAVNRHYFDGESLHIHYPSVELSAAENFLRMIRPDASYTEEEAHLLDMMMMIHAEHGGGNNSTFVCRALSSSGTDTYSAIAGAVGSLKGPLHGGANAKVMQMFRDVKEHVDAKDDGSIRDYLVKLLAREVGDRSGKIYGLGHAVYTLSDPRAVLIKAYAGHLAEVKGFAEDFDRRAAFAGKAPERRPHLRERRYVLRPCVPYARHPAGGLHAAVRHGSYRRLVRQPDRGGPDRQPHHAPGLPRRHHPQPLRSDARARGAHGAAGVRTIFTRADEGRGA